LHGSCQKHPNFVTKPDRSGSDSSSEKTESGTEALQKNMTVHFLKIIDIFDLKTKELQFLTLETLPLNLSR